jgi:hypothetical protein
MVGVGIGGETEREREREGDGGEHCFESGDKQFNVDLVDGSGGDMKCPPPA